MHISNLLYAALTRQCTNLRSNIATASQSGAKMPGDCFRGSLISRQDTSERRPSFSIKKATCFLCRICTRSTRSGHAGAHQPDNGDVKPRILSPKVIHSVNFAPSPDPNRSRKLRPKSLRSTPGLLQHIRSPHIYGRRAMDFTRLSLRLQERTRILDVAAEASLLISNSIP